MLGGGHWMHINLLVMSIMSRLIYTDFAIFVTLVHVLLKRIQVFRINFTRRVIDCQLTLAVAVYMLI